ncbi:MAG: transcription termination factor Rho [Candidatus Cloacimonetes bacterium]|nr:transcription termination factor Rho [Candidatus Cloacimonadota bacterium]MBL7108014.1 transcription termination factor Rho [Candidatus Cloacimonadota bacterium]
MELLELSKLQKMTLAELQKIAKKFDISDAKKMKKNKLTFEILKMQSENEGLSFSTGVMDITNDGYGFLRSSRNNYSNGRSDIYVSKAQIHKFNIKQGHIISGPVRSPKDNEKFFALIRIDAINWQPPEQILQNRYFDSLTPFYPEEKFNLETTETEYSTRIIDLFTPIGKGQRGLIVAAPRTGKTVLLQKLANSILTNHPDVFVIILLIDERPEEVTEMKRIVKSENSEVVSSTFDETAFHHVKLAEMVMAKAKRMVEFKKDVVILLDSITRLARAYNSLVPSSGKVLSGGVDSNALHKPKRFFGAARNVEEGGSLTIMATALIKTGSRMDNVIFEEFKGTGNMELVLSRSISDLRMYPAIDLIVSGTRKEELLLSEEVRNRIFVLRKFLKTQNPYDAIEFLKNKMRNTKNNAEFLKLMSR